MNLNKNTNISIISHFTYKEGEGTEVFPGNIRNFLLKKIGRVVYIDHPFIKSQGTESDFLASQMRIYDRGKKIYQLTTFDLALPSAILFIYQFFLTIFFLAWKPMKYDLCIACDNLSVISVFVFRKLGLIKKIIYYTVDYSPNRYSNPFLNFLYQHMDRLASKLSDMNWVAVEHMITAKVQNGLDVSKSSPFCVVPIGFNKKEIYIKPVDKIKKFNLVFVGIFYKKQGLQLVIEALPKLIKKFPKIHLNIIGTGPLENQIKKSVEKKNLSRHVTFFGYINNHQEVVRLLTNECSIGLAPYIPSMGDYTYFADPSKIKLYLMCGLPVITTKVPPIARKIALKNAGFAINYSIEELINAVNEITKNNESYSIFRKNAVEMSKVYDTNLILSRAFRQLK